MNVKILSLATLFSLIFHGCVPENPACMNVQMGIGIAYEDRNGNNLIKNNPAFLDSLRVFDIQNGKEQLGRWLNLDTLPNQKVVLRLSGGIPINSQSRQIVQFQWNQRDTIDCTYKTATCFFGQDSVFYNRVLKFPSNNTNSERFFIIIK
jgi:hypothetical protein